MPRQLAAVLTLAFIFWLFRRDVREKPNISGALWLPFFWLAINMSRYVSMWLRMFGIPVSSSAEDGTPVDALFYFGLILAGIYILNQRRVSLAELVHNNLWLFVFLCYCFLAIVWSDYPFVALKRWIKMMGNPIMALIVLTEPDPKESLIRLLKRCAYVLVPLSVLFIKYYPEWGRSFSVWTGQASNCGVAKGKNALGTDCLILSYFLIWYFLQVRQMEKGKPKRNEMLFCLCFIAMICWLFRLSNSKTPLAALIPGSLLMVFVGSRWVNPRLMGTYLVSGLVVLVMAELTVGVYENTVHLLGRNTTLTDRVFLWQDLLAWKINPVFGVGFESFWMGDRIETLWVRHTWRPNEAHNGYIETYLNLGYVGLALLLVMLLDTYRKARGELLKNVDFGRFRMGFLLAVVLYNWTEASFKALHPVWTVFFLIALDYPKKRLFAGKSSKKAIPRVENDELLSTTANV